MVNDSGDGYLKWDIRNIFLKQLSQTDMKDKYELNMKKKHLEKSFVGSWKRK